MAEDPAALPPYKPSAIKAAWELAGWKIPPIEPEEVVYETFLTLCDELVHSCPSLEDRLDAQGAILGDHEVEARREARFLDRS